jgi:hypothetical protein
MLSLRPVFALAVVLFLTPSWARADFMYSLPSPVNPGDLTGFFTVKDSAVASGQIFVGDITGYSFTRTFINGDPAEIFAGPITLNNPPIRVNASGDLVASLPNAELLVTAVPSGDQLSLRVDGTNHITWLVIPSGEGTPYTGTATVTHPPFTSAVREPASVALLASGVPLMLLFGWRRRRQRTQPLEAA